MKEQEDMDAKQERISVDRLDTETFFKYPLIVKEIRKVYPGFSGRAPKVANKSISLKI